jgi:dTDP-4-amino-4,6-dideoxygalactose transaminase
MGGMVVSDDEELALALRRFQEECSWPPAGLVARYLLKLLAYHVLSQPHLHRYIRWLYELLGSRHPLPRPTSEEEARGLRPPNYERRLSNGQAALGLRQLRRLDTNLTHRRRVADVYHSRLVPAGVSLLRSPPGSAPAFVRYPVRVEDREWAVQLLAPRAVVGTWFTSVLEEAASPADGEYVAGSCPRAEAMARQLINLPTHGRVRQCDVEAIASALAGQGLSS